MTIRTALDARNEKRNADAAMFARMDAREARAAADAEVLAANPHIGTLIRNGRAVYYTTANGYREARDPRTLA